MRLPSTIDACKLDLFTDKAELEKKYEPNIVDRICRVRECYTYFIQNPQSKDREIIDHLLTVNDISQSSAYNDLAVVKALLPMLVQASKDFHRWRANEMLLDTYQLAKSRNDTKTMERAAADYAKYNRVDIEDEMALPYDEIVVQPFTATDNPEVLGIKPIPNIQEKIQKMLKHYRAETMDIEDVEYEEADLEESELFEEDKNGSKEKERDLL